MEVYSINIEFFEARDFLLIKNLKIHEIYY